MATRKRHSEKNSDELNFLAEWSRVILAFIGEITSEPGLLRSFEAGVDRSVERRDLRGLRMMSKDLTEWARSLSVRDQEKLDQLLRARFGHGLSEAAEDARGEINRILRRGQIDTQDEYRLLMSRAEEIYADDSKAGELEQINRLLAAFQQDAVGD